VESTLAAEAFLRSEQAKLSLAAEEAVATEKLAWDRYSNGTGSFLSALDAQRTADLASARLVSINHLILQNRVDLYLALGGPFNSEQ
jgi:outer membrane protein TolC